MMFLHETEHLLEGLRTSNRTFAQCVQDPEVNPHPSQPATKKKSEPPRWKAKLSYVLKRELGAGEMAQWSWALAALPED